MTKELLKFEITEALAKVQVESAWALNFLNRGETAPLAAHVKSAKKSLNDILKLIREYNRKESIK